MSYEKYSNWDLVSCVIVVMIVVRSKSPTSSSYIIDLKSLDEKVTNVVDIQFLHGYYEPTLFILYEPLPTWTG